MVRPHPFNARVFLETGYTLIEMLVVIGIMGMVSALALYGIRAFDKNQLVVNAQRDFLTDLRSISNRVASGSDGSNFKNVTILSATSYTVDGVNKNLPLGIQFSSPTSFPLSFCFANPNLKTFTDGQCGACLGGSFFACRQPGAVLVSSGVITVILTNSQLTYLKSVRIEGSGMNISRIYAD